MLPNSAAARDVRHLVHGYVELAALQKSGPMVISGGKGIYIYDEKGEPYIEGASGMWCTAFGFGDDELVDAAVEQFRKLPYYHTLAYKSVNPAIDLAERLSALVPIENPKIYFAISGSEANDFIIKAIWYYNNAIGRPEKKKIISRRNAFHGATVIATALTGVPSIRKGFDVAFPQILHTGCPDYFHEARPDETPEQFGGRLADELEALILAEGPETVAAFIAEPVMGAGGVIIPPPGYYQKIQAILARYNILFLDDEVITGFCRTGNYWGCQTMGFQPSTMTLAKGLTSAYQPLAAVVLDPAIFEGMMKGSAEAGFFGHGSTYSGYPVGCAVALKVIDLIEKRGIEAHVRQVSRTFAARMRAFLDHPFVGEVRVAGLMGAIEFVADKAPRRFFPPADGFGKRVRDHAEEVYHLISRTLPGRDACAFSPPLIITEEEVNHMFDLFAKALDDVSAAYAKEHGLTL